MMMIIIRADLPLWYNFNAIAFLGATNKNNITLLLNGGSVWGAQETMETTSTDPLQSHLLRPFAQQIVIIIYRLPVIQFVDDAMFERSY